MLYIIYFDYSFIRIKIKTEHFKMQKGIIMN